VPREGTTGWSDTWMVATRAQHPSCMYRWMNHVISPRVNAVAAEWLGVAPANKRSCDLMTDKDFCDTYHAEDEDYWDRVNYRTTPLKACGDARGDVCKGYADWVAAWTQIKAS
jgi:putative spermidine/putrescine transport system substrate-binding protein